MPDSIINHRNMTRLYTIWLVLLVLVFLFASLAYLIQYNTPFITTISLTLAYSLTAAALAMAVLTILFRRVFHHDVLSWIFAESISIFGLTCFLYYGWNWYFTGFFLASLGLLLISGPYLYFE